MLSWKYIFVFLFAVAFNSAAQQELGWAKGLNGNASEGAGVVTDALGNIYFTGKFSGNVDFDPGPSIFNLTSIGSSDVFMVKLNPSGNFIWAKQMGGSTSATSAYAITLDNAGAIFLTGVFNSVADFDPSASALTLTTTGSADIFICKYDPNGNVIWARAVGSNTATDVPYSIKTDAANNVYVTGHFYGNVDFDPGPGSANLQVSALNNWKDIFILKLNSSGNYVWAKVFGSQFDDSGNALFLDGTNNIYIAGYYADVIDFDPGPLTYTLNGGSSYSAFISKLDGNGDFISVRTFTSASSNAIAMGISVDAIGNIYSIGLFNGTIDFNPNPSFSYTLASAGANDIYISKLDPAGDFLWAKLIGNTGNELPFSFILDAEGNLNLCGSFSGTTDFDPHTTNTFNLTSLGGDDVFISRLDPSGNFLCAGEMGGTGYDKGNAIYLDMNGDIICTGLYSSIADFDPSGNNYTISAVGSTEAYISKYIKLSTGAPLSYTICEGAPLILTGLGANTYSWSPATGLSATSGLTVAASPTTTTTYTVIGKGNCINTSTLITVNVKPKPTFIAPTSPQTVICIPDSILLFSASSNTNTIFKYRFTISSSYTNSPYYAKNSGNYYAIATDTFIGCSDSSLVIVKNGKIPPNGYITSHAYVNALTPIDTVTCYQPTVNLVGTSDTSGVVITWKSVSDNSVYPNPATITSLNNLKLIVKRNDNNCSDSSIVALVNQNNTPPTAIITNTTNTELNCSIYTASLAAIFSPGNCTSLWKTPSTSTITNPNVISTSGKYVLEVFNSDNGCLKKDSVNIIQTNSIVLSTNNNFTVCKSSPTTLTAQAIGTLSPISYSWSNGQTGNSVIVTNSVTTNYFVTATSGSCAGTGTILVIVPADIQDSIIAYRSCNDNTTGTILIFAKGGIQPYKYSINNGATFSSSNSYTGVPFANYNVVIKDSIGCLRQASVSVSAGNSLPVPKFLASTKNIFGDTIVLVDVSIPKPDSVQWVLPINVTKIGGTMFSPVVACSDTGNFSITMKGFYGNCIINTSKLVRFAPYDSLIANYTNANGIKTFSLYPNPNTGQFNVYIELYKKQNASIQVWDISPYKHYQQNFYDAISITLPVDVSFLQNGSYLLRVIAEFDAKNKAFIISK